MSTLSPEAQEIISRTRNLSQARRATADCEKLITELWDAWAKKDFPDIEGRMVRGIWSLSAFSNFLVVMAFTVPSPFSGPHFNQHVFALHKDHPRTLFHWRRSNPAGAEEAVVKKSHKEVMSVIGDSLMSLLGIGISQLQEQLRLMKEVVENIEVS